MQITLISIIRKVNGHGLLRDEQLGVRHTLIRKLQTCRPVEGVQENWRVVANGRGIPVCGYSLRHPVGQTAPVLLNKTHILTSLLLHIPKVLPVNKSKPHSVRWLVGAVCRWHGRCLKAVACRELVGDFSQQSSALAAGLLPTAQLAPLFPLVSLRDAKRSPLSWRIEWAKKVPSLGIIPETSLRERHTPTGLEKSSYVAGLAWLFLNRGSGLSIRSSQLLTF
jgi:hypothetical protein